MFLHRALLSRRLRNNLPARLFHPFPQNLARELRWKAIKLRGQAMTQTTDANTRMNRPLDEVDPQIANLLRDEAKRQATGLELIPSENLVMACPRSLMAFHLNSRARF